MQQGKIIFIENSKVSETILEKLKSEFQKKSIKVEFAADGMLGIYSLPEATLYLLQKGVKKITAFPFSLGEKFEIPVFWGTN